VVLIELVPVFQPIVDVMGTVKPIGYEALIRGRGVVRFRSAKDVFESADEHGGNRMLDLKIRDLHLEQGPPILRGNEKLFFNLPQHAFFDDSWLVLRSYANRLVIEINEYVQVNDRQAEWLLDFRNYGAEIAIDDYGDGHTSVKSLSRLNPDYLKMGMSFIKHRDYESIRKIRRFAEDWGAKLIVEGVETEMEAYSVMDAGVRYIQGFLYGKPREAHHWADSRRWRGVHQSVPP
jgi:EAL domain-containing protein (putative c-di-GMP-specific phosphodiesterase class I)